MNSSSNPKADIEKILHKIRELIKIAFLAVKHKINMNDRKNCFEIFGFDFMIDAEYNVWLIEVNTNPSIDESNEYLSMIIPRMIGKHSMNPFKSFRRCIQINN